MSGLLGQNKGLDIPNVGEISPWRNPIPRAEHTKNPVVVYFYSDRWIPLTCFSLAEAIALYRKALFLGKQILVYPAHVDPSTQPLSEESLEFIPVQEILKAS